VEYLNFEIDQFIAAQKWIAIFLDFSAPKFYKNTAAANPTPTTGFLCHHFEISL
jgi:hypothetical protein